jgi:hypothetical protein
MKEFEVVVLRTRSWETSLLVEAKNEDDAIARVEKMSMKEIDEKAEGVEPDNTDDEVEVIEAIEV